MCSRESIKTNILEFLERILLRTQRKDKMSYFKSTVDKKLGENWNDHLPNIPEMRNI